MGTLGDFAELLHQAGNRSIRVIIDLVVNHTSDQHPWFQSARSSPDSPYRDWYVWADHEPADRRQGMVFPGEQHETWTYDRTAKAWFYHRFYKFQPDLNIENPKVRAEIKKITSFWLQLGVSGFRMDAVPFIIERTEPGNRTRRRTSTSSPTCVSTCSGGAATRSCWRRRTSSRTSCPSTSVTAAARATGSTCCSTSCSTAG
ncbi:alpha-amylase family glycosyl hydrolase [Micromonospora sp. BRA006-A]|nr:alpha-amylase family glycosyl hydrolase [Micromonospora sp. BRA006-A]